MDIVAESLSAGTLKAKEVTIGGKRIIDWFESKLSASVTFVGVFDRISDAPKKNGAVAIVGNKDYIYLESDDEWQEFGDEGQIGAITQAIEQIQDSLSVLDALSGLSSLDDFITEETDPVFREMSASFLTSHQSLENYYQKSETSSAVDINVALNGKQAKINVEGVLSCDGNGNIAAAQIPEKYSDLSADIEYLTAETEPGFAAVSSTFLSVGSLNGYATEAWVTSKKYISSYTIPTTYKTYSATVSSLSGNGYVTQKMLLSALGDIESAINSL